MGSSLTGTKIRDTYDALIKVSDNGALDGTLQTLTDGLGNNSALSLSTAGASVGGTLAVSGAATLSSTLGVTGDISLAAGGKIKFNNDRYFSPENNVDGAEISANGVFKIKTGATPTERMRIDSSGNSQYTGDPFVYSNTTAGGTAIHAGLRFDSTNKYIRFYTNDITRAQIDSDGLKFNSDTAAANALDDYEEGTFTATLTPANSGTIGGNPTYTNWGYTKIGRQVTINGVFVVNSVSSPVGSFIKLGGLPFAILSTNSSYGSFSTMFVDASAGSAKSSIPSWHSIAVSEIWLYIDASTVAVNDEFYLTATYFA